MVTFFEVTVFKGVVAIFKKVDPIFKDGYYF